VAQANSSPAGIDAPNGKIAGFIIAACAALSIFAVALHPQATARSHGDLMTQLVALGAMDRAVHGLLVLFAFALLWGLAVFSIRRGFARPTVLAGFIAYAIGILAWLGAALIDGFITPAVAEHYIAAAPAAQDAATNLLALCAITIQILTKFGLIAISIGILKWSAGLLPTPGLPRTVGIIGIVAGLLPPAAVLLANVHLSPHSLAVIVIVQATWYIGIAALLIRERV
jgi:hypothetical protein